MDAFEALLSEHRGSVERLVKFRLPSNADAEDVLQEIWLTACRSFHTLRDPARFRPWIFQIARNRCNDYFRESVKNAAAPIETGSGSGGRAFVSPPVRMQASEKTCEPSVPPAANTPPGTSHDTPSATARGSVPAAFHVPFASRTYTALE